MPSGIRVKGLVTHEDVTPTILGLLGIRSKIQFDGQPLNDIVEKREGTRDFVVSVENTRMTRRAIRTERWKLIHTIRPDVYRNPAGHLELYDLKKDPEEKGNLAHKSTNRANMKNSPQSYSFFLGFSINPLFLPRVPSLK